jgi:hypothetical protein
MLLLLPVPLVRLAFRAQWLVVPLPAQLPVPKLTHH